MLVRALAPLNARPVEVDNGLWIVGVATEGLGLSPVQRVVLSLLLMPSPCDVEHGNKYIQELDPCLVLNRAVLEQLIQQLSETPPCQHGSILDSFGLDCLNKPTLDGPPSLDRLTTRNGGPLVPARVTRDWVDILLKSSLMRTAACTGSFKKHSQGSEGALREQDTMAFCQEVCCKLGVVVEASKLEAAVAMVHKKNADGLFPDNFSLFFERFLRQLSSQLPEASGHPDVDEQLDMLSPLLSKAVDDFRGLIAAGEWRGEINITLEDSVVLQRRI